MDIIKEIERIKKELEELPVKETDHPAWQRYIAEQLHYWLFALRDETKTPPKGSAS